jgi:hypothetical protein
VNCAPEWCADFNTTGTVNSTDLTGVLNCQNSSSQACIKYDTDDTGVVGATDLSAISNWQNHICAETYY